MTATILIIGNKGQLGCALERQAADKGIAANGLDMPELDLTNRAAVQAAVSGGRYTAVVNAAAYTAVDKAESDPDAAFAVNRDGVSHLAEACRENGTPLIHISTDYVFNGKSATPYKPDDPTDPLGVYGRSKAAGEDEVRHRLDEHVIIRTAWLCGVHGQNFVKTMIRLAKERKELRVVDDQKGSPTFAEDLANAILSIIEQLDAGKKPAWGTYHFCNAGITSWYQLAVKAISLASRYDKFAVENIIPITTKEYPTPAPRPAFSALDCSSFTAAFGVEIAPWEDSLEHMIDTLFEV